MDKLARNIPLGSLLGPISVVCRDRCVKRISAMDRTEKRLKESLVSTPMGAIFRVISGIVSDKIGRLKTLLLFTLNINSLSCSSSMVAYTSARGNRNEPKRYNLWLYNIKINSLGIPWSRRCG